MNSLFLFILIEIVINLIYNNIGDIYMDIEKRIEELTGILNEANYNYYVLDNPTITDQEFDKYLRELEELEEKYPEYAKEDSPTKRVGGEVIDSFKKVNHQRPMMSLSDVFSDHVEADHALWQLLSGGPWQHAGDRLCRRVPGHAAGRADGAGAHEQLEASALACHGVY